MEANAFVAKLKADGSNNDSINLDAVCKEYKKILNGLAPKDKGPFSLNVLCILCRNLEKVLSWRTSIDNKTLITLSVECTIGTRTLNPSEQVKTLACVYHIHKHVVRLDSPIQPEMVLKLSHLPFETETLNALSEYGKTYWNIIADRIVYLEKLKSKRLNILKTLPKLTDHVLQLIGMYNTVQFCSTILTFLVKKLHYLYSDLDAKELDKIFGRIFDAIKSKTDLVCFKKLTDKDVFDIYTKLNDCLYVVAENASKISFSDSTLSTIIRRCLSLIGHRPDLLHCFQNIYLNGFCTILDDKEDLTVVETVLTNFVATCETSEKLGYVKAMNATYPYLNQCLRLYIDFNVTNKKNWQRKFTEPIRIACLKLIEFLLKKLKNCNQILRCENCMVKSGLHDALRLSFSIKTFISTPLEQNMDVTKTLPTYLTIILQQYVILKDLCTMGCVNHEKCYRKLQSDVHNIAILLNKTQYFEYSIQMFEIYLKNEILHFKSETDLKNISRALYNKSICELDYKQYENALLDAYLSLIFAYPDGLTSDKYMSLVMDIKAKVLKTVEDVDCQADSEVNDLQTMTVLDACSLVLERKMYGSLRPFFCNLKFSGLLSHEFQMYVKLWPSVSPVAGVWKALQDLTLHDVPWSNVTDDAVLTTLQEVILETPTAVRTIHHPQFVETVTDLLQGYDDCPPDGVDLRIFHAALTFLKAEFDLAEAAAKYGWKRCEQNTDPDQSEVSRTLQQEYAACARVVKAVDMWSDVAKHMDTVPPKSLRVALQIAQVFVPLLLQLHRTTHGLRLAHACCAVAQRVRDGVSLAVNASALLYHARAHERALLALARGAAGGGRGGGGEAGLVLLTHCAMYYHRIKMRVAAARTLQYVQAQIYQRLGDGSQLDLASACLYEAQALLCNRIQLEDVIGVHRNYLNVGNSATKWTARRLRALCLRMYITYTGSASTELAVRLSLWRRARAAPPAPALAQAAALLAANPADTHAATVRVDSRVKYILGLQPTSDQPWASVSTASQKKIPPKHVETMLDDMTRRNLSPTLNCMDIPRFKLPCFLEHSDDCLCYACSIPYSLILVCQTASLEASIFFKAKQYDAAEQYYEGTIKCLELTERRLESLKNEYNEISKQMLIDKFREVKIEALIQNALFDISQGNFKKADESIVRILEILQDYSTVDVYLKNDVLNLITAAAYLRMSRHVTVADSGLDVEMDNLRLSPAKQTFTAATPISKAKNPPKLERITAKEEEIPNTKRRVIKLNLDDDVDDNKPSEKASKTTQFKVPVLVINKPILEGVTPVTSKKRTGIFGEAGTSQFATPKPNHSDKTVFFTPLEDSNEEFFTPMSTLKTYSKHRLAKGIVKNLENEFSTPESKPLNSTDKTEKENRKCVVKSKSKADAVSVKSLMYKKQLKRATSPGKLEKDETKPARPTRLRKPVKLSLDE